MRAKQLLFFGFVGIQFVIILWLGLVIYQKNQKVKGVSITVIPKKSIVQDMSDRFAYFYEPAPNTIDSEKPDWLAKAPHITINSDLLNERRDYEVTKPAGTFRIITLGDSFTYGQYVNTTDNWPELLEDALSTVSLCQNIKKFEVINLGMKGYDIAYAVERFRLRGVKYTPDLVIWLHVQAERVNEKLAEWKKIYTPERDKEVTSINPLNPKLSFATQKVIEELGVDGIIDYQKKELARFNDYYKGRLLLINTPQQEEYKELLQQFKGDRQLTDELQTVFPDSEQLLDGHPNKLGHIKISKLILEYLENNRNIVCASH